MPIQSPPRSNSGSASPIPALTSLSHHIHITFASPFHREKPACITFASLFWLFIVFRGMRRIALPQILCLWRDQKRRRAARTPGRSAPFASAAKSRQRPEVRQSPAAFRFGCFLPAETGLNTLCMSPTDFKPLMIHIVVTLLLGPAAL